MKVSALSISEVLLFEPTVFGDARGFFLESFNQARFDAAIGRPVRFVQDNHSRSARHVLRGLHYQIRQPQAKLIRVVSGEIFDVAVDLRRSSPNFGRSVGELLSAENKRQLWVPEGFGHGFVVLSESAEVLYKTTDYWAPEHERGIRWDDPQLAIRWPFEGKPMLSAKDQKAAALATAEVFA
jgi:dTDP-4-dehydrorhamnose 3,5-epimerase